MEYFDTGVTKQAVGIPSDEERTKLNQSGYTHMSNGITVPDENREQELYEIWIK